MKYLLETYRTLNGPVHYIDLGIFAYGEWIIYDGVKPVYHVNCFRENSESDLLIHELLKTGKFKIKSIVNLINEQFNKNFNLGKRPLLGIKIKSELTELKLDPIPLSMLEKLKNAAQQHL